MNCIVVFNKDKCIVWNDMGIHNRMFIDNNPPSEVVDRIISEYGLSVKKAGS